MSNRQYSIKTKDIKKLNSRLLSVSTAKDDGDWQSVPHTHAFTELFLVVKGEGTFFFEQSSYAISSGDLIITPPYTEHTERSSKHAPLEYYVLAIDGISFLDAESENSEHTLCNLKNFPDILDLFRQMFQEMQEAQYGHEEICQNLLEILILKIIRSWKLIPVPIHSVKMTKECAQIKEYLDMNYANHITLDTLTSLTHMNKYYMVHSFTKYAGLSPIQYLNNHRLEVAKTLLETSNHSIAYISSATGFSSQSYFTQAFRKTYGITPVKYRQLHTNSEITTGRK